MIIPAYINIYATQRNVITVEKVILSIFFICLRKSTGPDGAGTADGNGLMRCYPEKYGNGVTILHIAGAKVLENTYRNATYNASRRCSIIDSLKDADVTIL